jgi:NADH-quinone oxidoreductase subunit C
MSVAEIMEARFGSRLLETTTFRDDLTYSIAPDDWREVLEFCKESPDLAFDMLDCLIGDHLPERMEAPLQVVVHLVSHTYGHRLRIKVALPEGKTLRSLTDLWPSSNWDEREAWEMYGIYFTRHPHLRRLLTTDDFEGHPMRKDFPLQGTIGGPIRTKLKGKI